jgi:hypothetical protein
MWGHGYHVVWIERSLDQGYFYKPPGIERAEGPAGTHRVDASCNTLRQDFAGWTSILGGRATSTMCVEYAMVELIPSERDIRRGM